MGAGAPPSFFWTALIALVGLVGRGRAYTTHGRYPWCTRNAGAMMRGGAGTAWVWAPNNPCGMRDWSPRELQAHLRGRTILFVGDSTSRYQACSMWGMIADGAKGCAAQYKEDQTLRHGMFVMRAPSNVTVIFKWEPNIGYMSRWKHLEYFLNHTDVLILNSGLHLVSHGRQFNAEEDVSAARSLASQIKGNSNRHWHPFTEFPLVIWRETTFSQGVPDVGVRTTNEKFMPIMENGGLLTLPMYNLTTSNCNQDKIGHCTPAKCCIRLNQYLLNTIISAFSTAKDGAVSPIPLTRRPRRLPPVSAAEPRQAPKPPTPPPPRPAAIPKATSPPPPPSPSASVVAPAAREAREGGSRNQKRGGKAARVVVKSNPLEDGLKELARMEQKLRDMDRRMERLSVAGRLGEPELPVGFLPSGSYLTQQRVLTVVVVSAVLLLLCRPSIRRRKG